MNERIRELAEQAGFLNKDEESIQYFAELIVRECSNYVNSRIPGNIEVSATVAKMKKHFGVEEK